MDRLASIIACWVVILLMTPQGNAAELDGVLSSIRSGGYMIVFRHGATDDSQKDVHPFKFDDMSAQRQLSDKGRSLAPVVGAEFYWLLRNHRDADHIVDVAVSDADDGSGW